MEKGPNYYCWVVAYIDSKFLEKVQRELGKYPEYQEVEAYIPTIKILKKKFKKEYQYYDVPMLFNYGFFKIPRKYAVHFNYLDGLKKHLSCIYAWVKDPAKVIEAVDKENPGISNNEIPIATASSKEISELVKLAKEYSVHDSSDVDNLEVGQVIILHGYPFDGLEAEIVEINKKTRKLRVNLRILNQIRPVMVTYDNIFFTVYSKSSKGYNLSFDDNIDANLENYGS